MMDKISDSGFITGQEILDPAGGFHDFIEVARTSHSVLTTALKDGRRWMLKSLPEDLSRNPMYLALQRKEYEILCRLSHSAIVSVYELVDIPSLGPSIVMEYIDGETLDKVNLDCDERRKVAHSLAEAIRYIHSCQIVHRDLKPANILLTRNGHNVKIVDFGLADTDAHTILKQPAGTAGYISREQATSNIPDVRNDIYSLGHIFRELNLGWQYHWMIRGMLRPIEKRTATMTDVLKQMDTAERFKRKLLTLTTAIILLSALVAILHTTRDTPQPPKVAETDKPVIKDTVSRSQSKPADTVHTPVSEPTVKVKEITESKTVPEEPTDYGSVLAEGKAEVDAFMQQNHFKEMADTATCSHETRASLNRIMGKAATFISEYAKEHTGDEPTRMAMKKQLDEYVVGKYWSPYYIRTTKLQRQ